MPASDKLHIMANNNQAATAIIFTFELQLLVYSLADFIDAQTGLTASKF